MAALSRKARAKLSRRSGSSESAEPPAQSNSAAVNPELGRRQILDHVEMVLVGRLIGEGRNAESGPDIGQQRVLAAEFCALGAADPANQAESPKPGLSRTGLSRRASSASSRSMGRIAVQQQWPKIVEAGNRNDAVTRARNSSGSGEFGATSRVTSWPACRMAAQYDGPGDEPRCGRDRRGDVAGNLGDPHLRAKPIGRERRPRTRVRAAPPRHATTSRPRCGASSRHAQTRRGRAALLRA